MTAKTARQARAREALERRLSSWRKLRPNAARPHGGWVRAIREALGMSAQDLAERMGVAQPTMTRIEASERTGRIQLDTLERAADALGCDLVYALVPRKSLEQIVDDRARELAARRLGQVAHTMALEAQGLSDDRLRAKLELFTEQLKNTPGLWHETDPSTAAGPSHGLG
jgi:predicted DNA-binding mobile mystery protein A